MLDPKKYDTPKTAAMRKFLKKEAPHRVVGLSIETDGVFIYTDSEKWSDDAGAGTFREDSETTAIKKFYERVQPSILENPVHNLLARKDLKRAAALFRKSVVASKKHSNVVADAFNKYGDHGPQISGVIRDHFPKDVKDKLRKLAREVSKYSDAAYAAKPKGVRQNTMWKLSQAVADKYGHAFYGPQPTRKKNPIGTDEYIYQLKHITLSDDYSVTDKRRAKGILLALQKIQSQYTAAPDKFDDYQKLHWLEGEAFRIIDRAEYNVTMQRKNPVKKKTRKGNPDRITQAWLEKRADLINDMLKRPKTAYTETATGLKPNGGHFYIDYAYGGVGLEQMSAGGGAHAISGGHEPKKELNNFLNGFIEGIRATQDKRPRNPIKKKNPRAYSKKAAEKISAFRKKSRGIRKETFSIWKVANGRTTGLATSLVFNSKASAQKHCRENLNPRNTYAIVNSRLTSVGVNKALAGKA